MSLDCRVKFHKITPPADKEVNLTFYSCELQLYRRQDLSDDIKIESTPMKQFHSISSCRDSERYDHQLPASPAFKRIQCSGHYSDHLSFQKKNGEIEERKGCSNSVQQGNKCYVSNINLLTEDKFPTSTNSDHSGSTNTQCENRQDKHEKVTETKNGKGKCFGWPFFLFFCIAVIVVFLLVWSKPDHNVLCIVPT